MPEKKRIERNRTFIAIRIPDHLKKELAKVQRYLGEETHLRQDFGGRGDILRFIKPDDLHLTLVFLGDLSAEAQNIVISLCQHVARATSLFRLHPTQLGAFPRMNRPSVVWVGLGGETLIFSKLVYALEDALKTRRILPPSHKSDVVPHISIGMVSRKERRGNLRSVRELLEHIQLSLTDIEIPVKEIVVYQSHPLSHGPRYEPLKIVPLGNKNSF